MHERNADIVVLGAGPVGCALAAALHAAGRDCLLVEKRARDAAPRGFRPLALSHASRLILERIGAWHGLAHTPIHAIVVSQQGGFGGTRLEAAEAGVPALGYVCQLAELHARLEEVGASRGIESFYGAEAWRIAAHSDSIEVEMDSPAGAIRVRARCAVHAEGSDPGAHPGQHHHDALVGLLETEPASATTALERFTHEGALALLPIAGRYAMVWSTPPARAAWLAQVPQGTFAEALRETLGARIGRLTRVAQRAIQPLAPYRRASRVAPRQVFIGNAAQTLHPVAGQGLNLGLRDAWVLARSVADAPDPGDAGALLRYAAARRTDAAATTGVTQFLSGAWPGGDCAAATLRGLAMTALEVFPPARRFFARRMMFGPSAMP